PSSDRRRARHRSGVRACGGRTRRRSHRLARYAASPRYRTGRGRGDRVIRRYTLPEMGAIWTEKARFEQMLRVELAVTRAQAARGVVPADALANIESRAAVDPERIAEIEKTTDHDVIAFVSQVAETIGPDGRYLHLGLTSSDVV